MTYVKTDAVMSDCNRYRYLLFRKWSEDAGICCMFVGLNPSTADYYEDDPTIRRCVGFAQSWGCTSMYMMNAYAFRATDPKVMKSQSDPVGADTDNHIKSIAPNCSIHVACWGTHIESYRQTELKRMLPKLKCLGLTKDGYPKHPLYIANGTPLVDFSTGVA